jgi:hypothetical protein
MYPLLPCENVSLGGHFNANSVVIHGVCATSQEMYFILNGDDLLLHDYKVILDLLIKERFYE